jgi:hypothetical protein
VAGRKDHIRSRSAAVGLWSDPTVDVTPYAAFLKGRGFLNVRTFAEEEAVSERELGLDVAVLLEVRMGERLTSLISALRRDAASTPVIVAAMGYLDPQAASKVLRSGVDRAFLLCPPNFAFYRQVVTAAHHALMRRGPRLVETIKVR